MSKSHYVIDFETLIDCTVLVAEHYTGTEVKVFSISRLGNQLPELIEFLEQNKKKDEWHISFNGLSFDSQITQHILRGKDHLLKLSGETVAGWIYTRAQQIIESQDERRFA